MPGPNIMNLFSEKTEEHLKITKYISPLKDSDKQLITSLITLPITNSKENLKLNFENSFEYIRMYFNSGPYQGFKFYDEEHLIIFALSKKKKPHFKLFRPLGNSAHEKFPDIVAALNSISPYYIQTVGLDTEDLKILKKNNKLEIKNIKEFNYYIYDLELMSSLRGNRWKAVRQKISAFNRNHPRLKVEQLSVENKDEVVHYIGAWRRQLLSKRGLSYANLEKNKFAARFYADKNDFKNIWSTVYRLGTRVVAFQLLYRLGPDSAAHSIGLADANLKGLSETTQVDIWEKLYQGGIRYINDGPSWRAGLEKYKQKFNPISSQKIFECKIHSIS